MNRITKIGLHHIRYFVTLVDDLNFRHASDHLHVSQPAPTRTIQQIEEELQVTLFDSLSEFRAPD